MTKAALFVISSISLGEIKNGAFLNFSGIRTLQSITVGVPMLITGQPIDALVIGEWRFPTPPGNSPVVES